MNLSATTIKDWAGCVFAIGLVVSAAVYALMRGSSVGADIRVLRSAADSLNTTAQQAPTNVIDAGDIDRLTRVREDYDARCRDSAKNGLVVSQLSEAARKSGLKVVEIQPRKPRGAGKIQYPLYRVTVVGGYQRIASYMDGCKKQRIPARVVEFSIMPASVDGEPTSRVLRAEITVEAFAPLAGVAKGGTNGQA